MVSSFAGLRVASSGLAAQRRALETAGHNVANANTPGYSRQRIGMTASTGGSSMIHTGRAVYGSGVAVTGQERIVDQFLIGRANTERSALGLATELQQTYARVEAAYNEPGELGLAAGLEAFWDAWDAVATTPEDLAARAALLQRGAAVTTQLHDVTRTFDAMTADTLQRAEALAVDISSAAAKVAELNGAITAAMDAGASPNDLLDQRDELVRHISTAIGVTTRTDERGRMDISIGGAALVSGGRATTLSVDTSTPGAAVLRLSSTTAALSPSGGTLDGLLRTANVLVPGQQATLDAVAVQLRDAVNAQHALGQDLQDPPAPAGAFFTGTSARDLAVDPALVGNPQLVGAAPAGGGRFDGANALAIAGLASSPTGPDSTYRAQMAQLGVEAQGANRTLTLQSQLTRQVDAQRETVSGVSTDEEMVDLLAFQKAYEASARVMSAVDEMLDKLINGTGLVGR